MKKAIFLLVVFSALALVLTGACVWNAKLTVINDTGDDVTISATSFFDNNGVVMLTVPAGETVKFDLVRGVYGGVKISACGNSTTRTLDLTTNLQLRLPACEKMIQTWRPLWMGEPSLEKLNICTKPGMWWQY